MFNLREVFRSIAWNDRRDEALAVAELALWAATSGARLEMGAMLTIVAKIRELSRPEKKTAPAS